PRRRPAGLPRAPRRDGVAPGRHPAPPGRRERARRAVPEPGRHGQAGRDARRLLGRPRHPRLRRRLVAGGVPGAGGAPLRRARAGHRRVHPADEGAVEPGRAVLPRQVLPARGRDPPPQAGPAAAPADLDRRPHAVRAPAGRRAGRRLAPDRAAAPGGADPRRVRREGATGPGPRRARGAPRRGGPPDPAGAARGVAAGAEPESGDGRADAPGQPPPRDRRQGRRGHPRLPARRGPDLRLRLHRAGPARDGRADGALRGRRPAEDHARRLMVPTGAALLAADSRVARLATVDERGYPHLVPVCYATDGRAFYSALDAKPKRVPPERLRRVRNIAANPRVALLFDHYEEDWRRLRYVMVQGRAELLAAGPEREAARGLLRDKYP